MKKPYQGPVLRSFLIVVGLSALAALVLADTGTIKGRVTDSGGNPLKDVAVTLKGEVRAKTYVMTTDAKGDYYLTGIVPAEYHLRFQKDGYQTLEGVVSIVAAKESVFNAILMTVKAKAAKPAWEDKNVRAHDLYVQGNYAEALALYREILAVDQNVAFIHFDAGNCLFHLGDYEAAAGAYREAVRLRPDFFEAYTNLANAYGRLKRFDEAIALLDDAIRSYPSNGGLYATLGLLYLNSGQAQKAAVCLETAVALEPRKPAGYHSLGLAYTQTGEFARAIENYEKYIGLISDAKEIERVRGVIEQLKPLIKK